MADRRDAQLEEQGDHRPMRPRLLLTGMTRAQCVGRGRLGVWTLADQFEALLGEAGWDVTRRTAEIDDRPEDWDRVVVGVAPVLGLAARHAFSALRLLPMAWDHGNLATYIDDWQHRPILSNLRTVVRHPEYIARRTIQGRRPNVEWALANEDAILELAQRLLTTPWSRHIWNAFGCTGVHPEKLVGREDNALVWGQATWIDPSCTVRPGLGECLEPQPMAARLPIWVHAQLLKQETTWLLKQKARTGWGIKTVGVDIPKMQEPDLVRDVYTGSTGIIANPYSHRGSGCWRARYVHAAIAGAVILGHPAEMCGLPAYSRTIDDYEAMSPAELTTAATEQAETLRAGAWSRGRLREALAGALR